MTFKEHMDIARRQHPEESQEELVERVKYRMKHLGKKRHWKLDIDPVWIAILLLMLLFAKISHAQTPNVNIDRVGGTKVDYSVGMPVFCVSGCGSGGGGGAITAPLDVSGNVKVAVQNASIAVTGTFYQATQPVSIASMPTTPVTGTFWQTTQPVSGTFWQTTQPVSGTFWQATQPVSIATTVTVDGSGVTQPVSGTFWQATQPVSGTFYQATQPISAAALPLPTGAATESTLSGLLTDTQLRATPVPVSGTVSTGGLTDTQLRATAVPVSGTVSTGGLTDTQLRASAVPVSAAALPLPSGAATESTLATLTKPADQQHAIIDSGSTVVTQPTGSNLHIQCDSGCGGAATFADSDAFTFGTTPVNTMGAVVDDVATNAVSENSAGAPRMSTNRILFGDLKNTQTNTNALNVQFPSAQAVTQSGTWTDGINSRTGTAATAAWTSATAQNTTVGDALDVSTYDGALVTLLLTGAVTNGTVSFEFSPDGVNWLADLCTKAAATNANTDNVTLKAVGGLVAGTITVYLCPTTSGTNFRVRLSNAITSTGSLAVSVAGTNVRPYTNTVTTFSLGGTTAVTNSSAANLNATVVGTGTFVTQSTLGSAPGVDIGKLDNNQSVNVAQIAGTTTQFGNGTVAAGVQRVAIASDNTAFGVNATLGAETTKVIGTVNIASAQTLATVTAVTAITNALPAGTNLLGKVGIDQTTPGTTNAVEPVPDTASTVALSASGKATVTTSVNVKASAGNVYGFSVTNGAATVCWIEFVNNSGNGTLGTLPIFSVALPASGTVNFPPGNFPLANFSSGIAVGIATAVNGASACGTAGNITVFYK